MTRRDGEPTVPTIGILTALPKECAAVLAMLENNRRAHCDDFYLGEVASDAGSHHVAVGLLLDMGNNSAAVAATRMLREFPSIEDIIMCGIAGGVPQRGDVERDIRLGDIVVSDRGGVVQYDLVKEHSNGSKEHRHPPRPPSARLLRAVRHLLVEEEGGKRHWEEYLALGAKLTSGLRPADNLDARGNVIEYPLEPSRRAGVPRVFHGKVAASNTLLKNPQHRDYLGDTFGVKCVEMEGSGIADAAWSEGVGYLVVRGICDYCDEHKGDHWHGAAAVAAAAYVRALLASMRPAPLEGSRAVRLGIAAADSNKTATSTVGRITAAAGETMQTADGRAPRTIDPTGNNRSPLYNVPHRAVREFVGRDQDLEKLRAALLKGGPVAVSASLEGLPGVGKTELALQMVARLSAEGRFPGGIFWFDAESTDLTSTWGGTIADDLEIDAGPVLERAKTAMQRVRKGGPALIVLDNVTGWTGDAKPMPLPTSANVSLLVTTRQLALGGRQAFEHLSIECLDPEAAERLLKIVAGRDLGNAKDLAELIHYLDGHTLAVELAGAFLGATPECSPDQYLVRLRAGEKLGDKVSLQVRYAQTVDHALLAIWERLDANARSAWLILGEMAQADATLGILEACGVGEDERRVLRGFHLLMGDGQRWRMHRLVREYGARAGSPEERARARLRFVNGCLVRAQSIDFSTGYRIYVNEGPHLQRAIESLASGPSIGSREHIALLDRTGTAANSAGDFARAKRLLEQALTYALRSFGEGHSSVAACRANLALVLKVLGDFPQAQKLLKQALDSNLKTLGEGHLDVAGNRVNLAGVLKDLGDFTGAKILLDQALESYLKNFGEDHPSVATCRANLALVLQILGDLPQAKHLLEQVLDFAQRTLAKDDPIVATRRANLALVLQDLGDLPQAKCLLELALDSSRQSLGEDHPTVASYRSNLARVLQSLGDLPHAKHLLELALASNLKVFSEEHHSVATCRANLALVFQSLGELPQAKNLLEVALASAIKSLGEDYPDVAARRINLACVLRDLGDLPQAKHHLERALASYVKILGESHLSVASCRANLALVLLELGDLPQAKHLLELTLTAYLENLGEAHPRVVDTRSNLARLLWELGDLTQARVILKQGLASALATLGENHPAVATYRSHLATLAESSRQF